MTKTDNQHLQARPTRLLHTMLRVADLQRSIQFYTNKLGMRLHRLERFPEARFTLAFVGYGSESSDACIELTCHWDPMTYQRGTAYGHIAVAVPSVAKSCGHLRAAGVCISREAGPMLHTSLDRIAPENIAFIEDPDGFQIELIERPEQARANLSPTTHR